MFIVNCLSFNFANAFINNVRCLNEDKFSPCIFPPRPDGAESENRRARGDGLRNVKHRRDKVSKR